MVTTKHTESRSTLYAPDTAWLGSPPIDYRPRGYDWQKLQCEICRIRGSWCVDIIEPWCALRRSLSSTERDSVEMS
jgi:hypothetical protein